MRRQTTRKFKHPGKSATERKHQIAMGFDTKIVNKHRDSLLTLGRYSGVITYSFSWKPLRPGKYV